MSRVQEKTIELTVYFFECDLCSVESPHAFNEIDAYFFAKREGWEDVGEFYVCPDPKHARFKGQYRLLEAVDKWSKERDAEKQAEKGDDPPAAEETKE